MTDRITSFSGRNRFLSNFYPSPIVGTRDGITYPTAEHYFQAHKTLSLDERQFIAERITPRLAKEAGRRVTLRPQWEALRLFVMVEAIKLKFVPGSLPANLLEATGDAYLEEGSTWSDTYWGTVNGEGQNMLGLLLMAQRELNRHGI